METEVRLLRVEEISQAEHVLYNAFAVTVEKSGLKAGAAAYAYLTDAVHDGRVFGAYMENELAGVASIFHEGDLWRLHHLAIVPGRQSQGAGSVLLQYVENSARSHSIRVLELCTLGVMDQLPGYYKKHGFTEVRRGLPEHGRDTLERIYFQKIL